MPGNGDEPPRRRVAVGGGVGRGVVMEQAFLVVDDSRLARMVVRKGLLELHPGSTILEAASGTEADRIVAERSAADLPIAAVLIDFNMPDEDGLELLARLRAGHPELPLAIVSANAQTDIINRARALDAGFVEKPVSRDALARFLAGPSTLRRSA